MSILIGVGGGQSRGAGGSAAGAVRYDEAQQLTEAQQMLARKNQGLYYEMEVGEPKVAKYTDETVEWGRALVSTDTPDDAAINGLTKDGVDVEYKLLDVKEGEQDDTYVQVYDEGFLSWETVFTVQRGTGITSATGIYIGSSYKDDGYELHYGVQTEKQGIPNEYIIPDTEEGKMQMRKEQGLYYEETGIVEKTTEVYSGTDPNTDFRKVSSDAPAMEDIAGVILNFDGAAHDIPVSELTLEWETENECYQIRQVSESEGWEMTYFTVVLMDGYGGLPAGIFASAETDVYHQQLVYKASETVVSKVPEKFLPDDSLTTAEIDTIWDSVMD